MIYATIKGACLEYGTNGGRRVHVMIVSRGIPTKEYHLNGIFEFDQAKALAEEGVKVTFLALDTRSIRRWRKWGAEQFEKDGVEVLVANIPWGRFFASARNKVAELALKRMYKKAIKRQGVPDVIHAHFFHIGYVSTRALDWAKVPIIVTEHFSGLMKKVVEKKVLDEAGYAYEHADKSIAVSPGLVHSMKEKFNIEAIYVPNIVDTGLFRYIPAKEKETFDFITVANLIERKRIDNLIHASAELFSKYTNMTLAIYGEGTERNKIEWLIRKYSLEDKVFLMGNSSRAEIAQKMLQSDCFVLPSQAETFGVVYIEAMASGKPVIATKCGGPEGFVNQVNGLLIPIDDEMALVNAMEEMYLNVKRYDGENIAKETVQKFSPRAVAKQLIQVYEEVLKEKTI